MHNLADYCGALGATVRTVRNDADWQAAVATFRPTHLILSPGPGWPQEAGCTIEGVIPFFEAFDRMKTRPSWAVHFLPDRVKAAKMKKEMEKIQRQFFEQ